MSDNDDEGFAPRAARRTALELYVKAYASLPYEPNGWDLADQVATYLLTGRVPLVPHTPGNYAVTTANRAS